MINSTNFQNITSFGAFTFEINYISEGFLLTSLMFVFFIIIIISLYQFAQRDLAEVMAFSGLLSLAPSIILATITYKTSAVLPVWVPIFFLMIGAAGLAMMYLFERK